MRSVCVAEPYSSVFGECVPSPGEQGSLPLTPGPFGELKKKFADFEGLCAAYVTADAVLTQIVDALPSEPAPLTQTAESPSARGRSPHL